MSENRTVDELLAELDKLKDDLCDLEDMHAFTFVKTSVHIGAEKAQNMQEEYDAECKSLRERIAVLEQMIGQQTKGCVS